MKKNKYIREIADQLPPVYQQSICGYYMAGDHMMPNIVNVEVNHERRLRKAYQQLGIDGIKAYLTKIHDLQIAKKEKIEEPPKKKRRKKADPK